MLPFPPLFKNIKTRWDEWNNEKYLNGVPIFHDIDRTVSNFRKRSGWVYLDLLRKIKIILS